MPTATPIQSLIQMYNTWDYKHIEGHISEDIVYSSAWVLLPIEGKTSFINFIKKKLRTMQLANEAGKLDLVVTKVRRQKFIHADFIKLSYRTSMAEKEVLIKVTINHSLIKSIELLPI